MTKSLVEQARDLAAIPKSWPHQREEATERLLFQMAEEIERLGRIVAHVCPDKSDDI